MRNFHSFMLLSILTLGALGISGCEADDGNDGDQTGICFWECDDQSSTASIEGTTEAECQASAEDDEWCDELGEVVFEAGCETCEDCAPDWYECW